MSAQFWYWSEYWFAHAHLEFEKMAFRTFVTSISTVFPSQIRLSNDLDGLQGGNLTPGTFLVE